MRIGVLRAYFRIHDAQSLKQKRMVMRSIRDRLMSNYNISLAEIGCQDKWQVGEIGIATVGGEHQHVNSSIENVRQALIMDPRISIIEDDIEII